MSDVLSVNIGSSSLKFALYTFQAMRTWTAHTPRV